MTMPCRSSSLRLAAYLAVKSFMLFPSSLSFSRASLLKWRIPDSSMLFLNSPPSFLSSSVSFPVRSKGESFSFLQRPQEDNVSKDNKGNEQQRYERIPPRIAFNSRQTGCHSSHHPSLSTRGWTYGAAVYRHRSMLLRDGRGKALFSTVSHSTSLPLSASSKNIPTVDKEFVKRLSDTQDKIVDGKKYLLLDVREPSELKTLGCIPGAVNIPLKTLRDAFKLDAGSFHQRYICMKMYVLSCCVSCLLNRYNCPKPDIKEVTLVVYCQRGVRSTRGCEILTELGIPTLNYVGSYADWSSTSPPSTPQDSPAPSSAGGDKTKNTTATTEKQGSP
ncbi:rhodanese family domain-containing protein [Cystoisospora suis]|uniref:Rhodanese family domain-containing protein n=1 Tax=Cystoisospora suis TaxID=483139 RepID=A0A2C6KZC9_9APIC|nr:rhodanese family domain-containing protein [Cystoisospora suis]